MAKFKILEKFNKAPLPVKIGVTAGTGLLIFFLLNSNKKTTPEDGQIVYPYTVTKTGDAQGSLDDYSGSGSGSGSGSYLTVSEFEGWASAVIDGMNTLGQMYEYPQASTPVGVNDLASFTTGYNTKTFTEGQNTYDLVLGTDGSKSIYKNGVFVPESNYKYIPSEIGGTRTTGSGLGTTTSSSKSTTTSSSSSSSSGVTANQKLQQAQAAYGAAKTDAERKAATAAGQAARAAGATDAGAQAVWKSL